MSELEKTVEQLAEAAIEAAKNDWYEGAIKDWPLVKSAASSFVQAYNKYQTDVNFQNDFATSIASQLQNLTNTSNSLIGNLKFDDFTSLRAVYLLGFKFQNLYQRYFDQSPSEVAYVTDTGQIYTGSIQYLALQGTGQINKKGQEVLRVGGISEFLTKVKDMDQKLLVNYKSIAEEMQKYYNKLEELTNNYSNEQKENSRLFYKYTKKDKTIDYSLIRQNAYISFGQNYQRILNYGDLKEALVKAWRSGKTSRRSILSALQKVSNKGAILEEDVDQFAVKSSGAKLPQLSEFVILANAVINSGDVPNRTQIENSISKHKEGVRNIVLNAVQAKNIDLGFGLDLLTVLKSI